jgi:TonB-linked SusC/RagA family outer membrane protein
MVAGSFCFALVLIFFEGNAQERTLTGKVLSSDDNTSLPGVSVLVKGTATGTVTDADGSFSIVVSEGVIVQFSYIGFTKKEILVGPETQVTVLLEPDINLLGEVVMVGYGEQKRANLTAAVSTLDMKVKENTPTTNASQALHGVPGLWVNQPGGKPGQDVAQIRIRGVGTTNSSEPLVLVNGIEYNMNEVNPSDIETITVLKDASAAIYGSRGANGVILITTKTGKKDQPEVNYSFSYGIQKPTMMPDVVWNPIQYMQMRNQALVNQGQAITYTDAQIEEYRNGMVNDPYTYPNINWFDYILKDGYLQQHNLRFSGGNEKTTYSFSLGYMDQDGILIEANHANRYTINMNVSTRVSDKLKVGGNLIGNYRTYTENAHGTSYFFNRFMRVLPIFTPYLPDGTYGNAVFATPGRNAVENPVMLLKEGSNENAVQRILVKVFADYQLPFNLMYSVNFGVDKLDGSSRQVVPFLTTYNPKTKVPYLYNNNPYAYDYNDNNLNYTFYQTLTWDKLFADKHTVGAMIGQSFSSFELSYFSGRMEGYFDETITDLNAGVFNPTATGAVKADKLASYFGRFNYNYNEKYFLEATFRVDGSSRFAPGHRWGFFPAAMAAWRLDQEPFLADLSFISALKLRASWGKLGNIDGPLQTNTSMNRYLNTVSLGQDYSFGNTIVSGAARTAYNDPNITWETTTTYNAGLDFEGWDGLLGVTVDVFKKRTTDILRTVSVAAQAGNLSAPQRNIGTVDNTGFELVLSHRHSVNDFKYEVSGSVAYVKNEIVDLKGQTIIDGVRILKEGYPINSYYIYRADGIYQNEAEVAGSATLSSAVKPGYIKYWDKNPDDKIDGNDRIITGGSIPKYNYSFSINLGYKRWSLNSFFQGVQGINIYPTANLAFPFNNGAGVLKEWATDSWTPQNPDARLPILTTTTATENYVASTFWLKDASYLRLKNIQLKYDLPEKLIAKISLRKLSVFANGENLVTFSKYDQFDPEKDILNNTLYEYPSLRTYSVGVNATF